MRFQNFIPTIDKCQILVLKQKSLTYNNNYFTLRHRQYSTQSLDALEYERNLSRDSFPWEFAKIFSPTTMENYSRNVYVSVVTADCYDASDSA